VHGSKGIISWLSSSSNTVKMLLRCHHKTRFFILESFIILYKSFVKLQLSSNKLGNGRYEDITTYLPSSGSELFPLSLSLSLPDDDFVIVRFPVLLAGLGFFFFLLLPRASHSSPESDVSDSVKVFSGFLLMLAIAGSSCFVFCFFARDSSSYYYTIINMPFHH